MNRNELKKMIKEELIQLTELRSVYNGWNTKNTANFIKSRLGRDISAGEVTSTDWARISSALTELVNDAFDEGQRIGEVIGWEKGYKVGQKDMEARMSKNIEKNTRRR